MKFKATQGKEVVLRVTNRIGILADLAKIVADAGISLSAVSATVDGDTGIIRLVTEDNLRTGDVLRSKNYNPHEEDVVTVRLPHKPGMLHRISECLATEMIDVHHLYATSEADARHCLVVLRTANNDRALVALNAL